MANAVQMKQGDVATLESRLYEVAAGLKITLPYEVQEKSVRINGFEEAAEAVAGKFSVVITSTGEGAPNTVITFAENDVAAGDTLRVAYRRRVNGASVATAKTNCEKSWEMIEKSNPFNIADRRNGSQAMSNLAGFFGKSSIRIMGGKTK